MRMRGARRRIARPGRGRSMPAQRQHFAPAAEADAAARSAAEAFLGHRDRDAAPRSLCDLCPAHSRPAAARAADPRSRCGRARHAVPRHPAPVFDRRSPIRARRRPWSVLHRGGPRDALPSWRLPADVEAVWWPRFEKLARQHHRMGARPGSRRRPAACRGAGRKDRGRPHRRDAVRLCRPRRPAGRRHGRHSRLQDRLVAVQGAGAHAARAAAGAGRRAAQARRLHGAWRARTLATSPSSG